jgi:tetratricopeptide (TPR) repeat protein
MLANASPDPINRIALLNDGDRAYEQRVDEAQARHALETYRKLHEENPDDVEASWRLSMACYFVGLRLTQDNGKKATLFAEGRDAGRAAIEKKTGCAPCYFWSAINMALYGQSVGVLKMLFTLGTVRDYLRKSIELDPTYASAGAYRLLGVIEEKLPGILGGDNDRAREDFKKAIALAPDEPLNYLFMSRLLDDEFSDRNSAIDFAHKGLEIKNIPAKRLESIEAQADLKKWLESLR